MATFAGQHALVTGGSSGIGKAIALCLAREGATLWIVGRDPGRLSRSVSEISSPTSTVVNPLSYDLADRAAVRRLAQDVAERAPRLDVLVHSAGRFELAAFDGADVDDLQGLIDVNVVAPYLLTRELLPLLRRDQGQIVFLNSSVGIHARGGVGHYSISKHGQRALADSLREEVNDSGIRVLSVFAGRAATPMQRRVHELEGKRYQAEGLIQPADIADMVGAALALPRSAEVTDLHIRSMRKP